MAVLFVEINPLTHRFIDLFNSHIEDDAILDDHDVSVNAGTDGSLVVYWAHKPSRRQRNRFKRLLRQTQKALLKRDDSISETDLDHLRLGTWLD